MPYELLLVSTADRVATITVNRPDKLNALNAQVLTELGDAMTKLEADADVGAIIITGAGRSFVAGADISELAELPALTLAGFAAHGQEVLSQIEESKKPVIAAVNGFALGGGCELALACHVRFASTKAKFGLPEVKLGLIPGYGGTQRLPRLVGRGAALKLIMSGEPIDAAEAHRIGLVDAVTEPDALLEAARGFAASCTKNGPIAVARAIEAVHTGLSMTLGEGLGAEATLFGTLGNTSDMREGTRAFLEKRPAAFKGA